MADDFQSQLMKLTREHCTEVECPTGNGSSDLDKELAHFRRTMIRGPILNMILSAIKSIQVTSVVAERSFSLAGRFVNKLRTKLSDDSINALVILKCHYNNKQ